MSSRNVPAAAVPEGALVIHPDDGAPFLVDSIENGEPRPGLITWGDGHGKTLTVGGAQELHVTQWPPRKEHPS